MKYDINISLVHKITKMKIEVDINKNRKQKI